MKLSIIVPCYNLAPYIYECLLSLLTQKTNFEYEVVVCDDCSKDESFKLINYLENSYGNLKVIRNKSNVGLVETMKRLLSAAKGEYIAYLDGDDVALPGKLQKQVDYLNENQNCSMVYHESEVFDSFTGDFIKYYTLGNYNYKYIPKVANIKHLIKYSVFLQASSIMFRRHDKLLESLEHNNKIICDYPWQIMNLGLNPGTLDRIPSVLGRYRIHSNSFGAQTQRNFNRRVNVTEELVNACKLGLRFGIDDSIVKFGINHIYFSAALFFLKNKSFELFELMILKSACSNIFFDERHVYAFENYNDPNAVLSFLGWK